MYVLFWTWNQPFVQVSLVSLTRKWYFKTMIYSGGEEYSILLGWLLLISLFSGQNGNIKYFIHSYLQIKCSLKDFLKLNLFYNTSLPHFLNPENPGSQEKWK